MVNIPQRTIHVPSEVISAHKHPCVSLLRTRNCQKCNFGLFLPLLKAPSLMQCWAAAQRLRGWSMLLVSVVFPPIEDDTSENEAHLYRSSLHIHHCSKCRRGLCYLQPCYFSHLAAVYDVSARNGNPMRCSLNCTHAAQGIWHDLKLFVIIISW